MVEQDSVFAIDQSGVTITSNNNETPYEITEIDPLSDSIIDLLELIDNSFRLSEKIEDETSWMRIPEQINQSENGKLAVLMMVMPSMIDSYTQNFTFEFPSVAQKESTED